MPSHHANVGGSLPRDISLLRGQQLDFEAMTSAQNLQAIRMLLSHPSMAIPEGSPMASWLRDLALLAETAQCQVTVAKTAPIFRTDDDHGRQESQ